MKTRPIEFTCDAPEAQTVFVAGTFNDWNPDAMPLHLQTDGHWRTTLPLPAGHHEFKFIVDGQWCCANSFGTMNRVLEV